MNILIPMAGEGSRFKDEGYTTPKPLIPTFDRKTKTELPMVIAATHSLPYKPTERNSFIFVDRDFHKAQGVEDTIKAYFENNSIFTLDKLTEGQACTALMAKDLINNDEELLIGACDCGVNVDLEKFEELKKTSDCIVFTFTGNDSVNKNPNAYGWMQADETGKITGVSIKKAISSHPMDDPAVTAIFWFKHGKDFVKAAEKMIAENDRVNNEFYVDQTIKHVIDLGLNASIFNVDKYFCWGTPKDYEDYQKTVAYWENFRSTFKKEYGKEFGE